MKLLVLFVLTLSLNSFAFKTCYDNKKMDAMDVVSLPQSPIRYISENIKMFKHNGDVRSRKMTISHSGTGIKAGGNQEVDVYNYNTSSGMKVAKYTYNKQDFYIVKNDATGCTTRYKLNTKNELVLIMDYKENDALIDYFKGGSKVAGYKDANLDVEGLEVIRKVLCVSVENTERFNYKDSKMCKTKILCQAATKSHQENQVDIKDKKIFEMVCKCEAHDKSLNACMDQYLEISDKATTHYKQHSKDFKVIDGVSNQ